MVGGSFHVKVTTNASEVAAALGHFRRDQLPFATAVALTRTAESARDELRGTLGRYFKIRSKRVARGITFNPARKGDWPRQRAVVGTRDEFMADHALGRQRKGRGHRIAVPTRFVESKRTSTGKIPKRLKPGPVIAAGGAIREGLDPRVERKLSRRSRPKIKITQTLHRRVKIPRHWPFVQVATFAARRTYRRHFITALERASQTAR
jgi:hypothetical protein